MFWLDFTAGTRYWSAKLDEPVSKNATSGRIRDLSLHTDLHLHFFEYSGLRPYVVSGLAGHFVSADIDDDPRLEDALSGFNIGIDTGFGVASTRDGIAVRGELRRQWVEDVSSWTFSLGVGWWPNVRAQRIGTRLVAPKRATTYAVTRPQVWDDQPDAWSADPEAPSTHSADPALRALLERIEAENRSMRVEIDSLRSQLGRGAAEPPPVQSIEIEDDPQQIARERLRSALERMAALSGRPNALRENAEGFVLDVESSLGFAVASSELQISAREELRRLAVVLLRFPDLRLIIDGHTDSLGSAANNQRLSVARAEAVRNELIALGTDASRIEARGFGPSRPVADNDTPEGRAMNRRVEIRIQLPSH